MPNNGEQGKQVGQEHGLLPRNCFLEGAIAWPVPIGSSPASLTSAPLFYGIMLASHTPATTSSPYFALE